MKNEDWAHRQSRKSPHRKPFLSGGLLLTGFLACAASSPAQTQNVSLASVSPSLFALDASGGLAFPTVLDATANDSLSPIPSYRGLVIQTSTPETQQPVLAANPGRPAMATSALLTPVGYAQVETGYLYARDSAQFSNRNAEEQTMRVTVSPRAQFIVAGEPVAGSQTEQQSVVQHGDTTAGLQVVLMPGQAVKPTISASYLRLLHGGNATSLDIGGYVNSALLMQSADLGHFHVDCNEFFNETEGPVRRLQFGQATAVSYPVNPKLSAIAELRHFTQPLNAGTGVSALWGTAYAVRPNLVFDTGLVRGFTGTSTQWQVASGVTYVLPRKIWGFSRGAAHL
jgi:hypothetical protein